MSVTVTNLIQGPATLYHGLFGATEPADIDTTPATGWTDLGGTNGGAELTVELTFADLDVDQVVDVPGATLTKRMSKVKTNLAEATLENWARAQNQDVADISTSVLEPTTGLAAFQPVYSALILDGIAPGGFLRRVILRRTLQIGAPGQAFKKDGQTLIPVEFAGYYVSSSIAPYYVEDATS
jgi:hypothetical protein